MDIDKTSKPSLTSSSTIYFLSIRGLLRRHLLIKIILEILSPKSQDTDRPEHRLLAPRQRDKMEVSIEDLSVLGSGNIRRRSTRIKTSPSTRSNSFDQSRQDTPTLKSCPPTETKPDPVLESKPNRRGGLRKRRESSPVGDDPMIAAMKPLTDQERQDWKGWVELESNPVRLCSQIYLYPLRRKLILIEELFNYILRQYGTKDVKVQEVYSLDDETLSCLPQPVHGLIFLYRYQEDEEEEDKEMKDPPPYSNHVWFANQVYSQAT